jgi:hypothetical protein
MVRAFGFPASVRSGLSSSYDSGHRVAIQIRQHSAHRRGSTTMKGTLFFVGFILATTVAQAQNFLSGSTGADGALVVWHRDSN